MTGSIWTSSSPTSIAACVSIVIALAFRSTVDVPKWGICIKWISPSNECHQLFWISSAPCLPCPWYVFVLFTRQICDCSQLLHRIVQFSAGRSWQIPNRLVCFCNTSPSRKTPTRRQAPRQYMFDSKVCGHPCPKLVAPPDNMHYMGELLVNIGICVFQPGHLF